MWLTPRTKMQKREDIVGADGEEEERGGGGTPLEILEDKKIRL